MDIVWQRCGTGNGTIAVGPFTTKAQAIAELRKKLKKNLAHTNVIDFSPATDVSNMVRKTRVFTWVNGVQGTEIPIKAEMKNGKWHAGSDIPAGTIHITFYE